MKSKVQIVAVSLVFAVISILGAPRTLAQHSHDHKNVDEWKTGMLRISEPVRVGNVQLKSGMYHVKHVVDGNTHALVFMSVALPAGYREFSMVEQKEVARLQCEIEALTKSSSNTKMQLARNTNGELAIQEVQIAGEKVKHVLTRRTVK